MIETHKLIRKYRTILIEKYRFEIIGILAISSYLLIAVSFRLFYVGWELTIKSLYVEMGLFLGIYYALIDHIRQSISADPITL